MPEMWAHCEPCSRWFFVPFDYGEELVRSACPVCTQQADRFEVRLNDTAFPVELLADPAPLT